MMLLLGNLRSELNLFNSDKKYCSCIDHETQYKRDFPNLVMKIVKDNTLAQIIHSIMGKNLSLKINSYRFVNYSDQFTKL